MCFGVGEYGRWVGGRADGVVGVWPVGGGRGFVSGEEEPRVGRRVDGVGELGVGQMGCEEMGEYIVPIFIIPNLYLPEWWISFIIIII